MPGAGITPIAVGLRVPILEDEATMRFPSVGLVTAAQLLHTLLLPPIVEGACLIHPLPQATLLRMDPSARILRQIPPFGQFRSAGLALASV
jgi:hypothetical protein